MHPEWQGGGLLRNPFSGRFDPLKECGRHFHRYLGKVKFFGSIGSQKGAKNAIFLQGGLLKPSVSCRVKRIILIISILFYLFGTSSNVNHEDGHHLQLGMFLHNDNFPVSRFHIRQEEILSQFFQKLSSTKVPPATWSC